MNIDELKSKASGQWTEILSRLCSLSLDAMDGRKQPCPKLDCGGTDRFRVFGDFAETGGMVCSHCGSFADGIAAVGWLNGLNFQESLRLIGTHLGIEDTKPARRKRPSKKFEPPERRAIRKHESCLPEFIADFAAGKPGCEPEQIARCLMHPVRFVGFDCLAFVSHRPPDMVPYSWVLYRKTGEWFPVYGGDDAHKTHFLPGSATKGKQDGIVIVGTLEEYKAAEVVYVCEGITDAIAVSWLFTFPGVPLRIAVARICGAGSFPPSWQTAFEGKEIIAVGDNEPSGVGRAGACKVAEVLR